MQRDVPRLFTLRASLPPWGDYGSILVQGMSDRAPDGTLLLRRTGPFIPPISFPFPTVVVTAALREGMESQNFTGLEFHPVARRHIVHLDWRAWDLTAAEPAKYPETGEPEDYILRGRHDPDTARELGELWEVRVPIIPGLQIEGSSDFDPGRYRGDDACRGNQWGHLYVSHRLRDWLAATVGEWVRFAEAHASVG